MKLKNESKLVKLFNARINKGVKYLDKKLGRKVWLEKIDVLKLDLENTYVCIVGQAFIDGWNQVANGNLEIKKAEQLGFYVGKEKLTSNEVQNRYDLLTYLWAKKLVALKFKNGFKS